MGAVAELAYTGHFGCPAEIKTACGFESRPRSTPLILLWVLDGPFRACYSVFMEPLGYSNWYLIRAASGFKEAIGRLLPDVDVYQPTRQSRHYNRRLRKWVETTRELWPGYAFVRKVPDFGALRCSELFHGLVRVAGDVVSLRHDQLALIHREVNDSLKEAQKAAETPAEDPIKRGSNVTVNSHLVSGTAKVLSVVGDTIKLVIENSAGNALKLSVGRNSVSVAT